MDASKVTISLHSPMLKGKRKQALRLQRIAEFIEARPFGKRLMAVDVMEVGNFKTLTAASAWLKRASEQGKLIRHEIGLKSYYYTVPHTIKVTSPPARSLEEPTVHQIEQDAAREGARNPSGSRGGAKPTYNVQQLKDKAMRYQWHYDSFSIKQFLSWLESQEEL